MTRQLLEILLEMNKISSLHVDQLDDSCDDEQVGEILIKRGIISSDDISEALAIKCGLKRYYDLPLMDVSQLHLKVPYAFVKKHVLLLRLVLVVKYER